MPAPPVFTESISADAVPALFIPELSEGGTS